MADLGEGVKRATKAGLGEVRTLSFQESCCSQVAVWSLFLEPGLP